MKKHFVFLLIPSVCYSVSLLAGVEEIFQDSIPEDGLWEVFLRSPIIYSLLMIMGVSSFFVWVYSILTLKISEMMPEFFINEIRELLISKHYEKALDKCQYQKNLTANILAKGIEARKDGPQCVVEAMQTEGQRCKGALWQKIEFLNNIAIAAPCVGFLGTLLGLYFSAENDTLSVGFFYTLLEGLSLSIGTTILGLIISIVTLLFVIILRTKLSNLLNTIISELLTLVRMANIDYS